MPTASEISSTMDQYVAAFERRELAWSRNGRSASALASVRRAAMDRFRELGFPTRRHEDWRHTDVRGIEKLGLAETDVRPEREAIAAKVRAFDYGAMDCFRLTFVNGRLMPEFSALEDLPDGLQVSGLAEAMQADPAAISAHLARYADFEDHPFIALNTAFISDGAYVHAARDAAIEKPIHLLFLTASPEGDVVSQPRNLIVAEPGASVSVVESYGALGEDVYFTNAVTEIVGLANSHVRHYKLQRGSFRAYHFGWTNVHLERDANFQSHLMTHGGKIARDETTARLDGENIECTLNGLYLANGDQHIDHHTRLDHAKPHCNSYQVYRGIADDAASGVFNGRILVREHAQKTDAKQSSMNLVLKDTASATAEPQLEIHADDVKCTHGATIGQLDETALFYLRSRGIDRQLARTILTIAFADEVLERMELKPVRDFCERLVFDHFQSEARDA